MKNKGETQDELTRELTELAQQRAQSEELQIEHVQELSKLHSAILEATTDFVGIASADGRLQYINPAGLEMCGLEKGTDVTKYTVQDFHPEWINKLLREKLFPICAKEGIWSGELEFLHQDGHEILTSAVILGHKLQNGELAYVSTISRDIAESRGLEQALRESEERFRNVTELAIEAIILANQNGNIISWNKGAQTIFGYTEDEVLDREISFLMPERYRDAHRKGLQRVTSTGKSSLLGKTLELVGKRKDGTEFPMELSLTSWTTSQERVYNAIIRDITERRQVEEQLQQARDQLEDRVEERTKELSEAYGALVLSEKRLRLLSDALPVLVSYVDAKQHFRFNNRAYEKFMQLPREQMEGRHIREVLGEKAYAVIRSRVEKALTGQEVSWEGDVPFPDGITRRVEGSYIPHINPDGLCLGFYAVVHDISQRVRVEEELRQHREELAHVSRVQTMAELATSVAHELNQPLTAILTNTQTLVRLQTGRKADEADDEELKEILQDIVEDATRAGQMIRRQRDFLRRGELQKHPLDLNEMICGVEPLARPEAFQNNVRLVLDLTPDLPEVIGDYIQLQQVLLNLIRNGSEAMTDLAEYHCDLVVKTSMSASGTITVAVRDTGPSLKDEAFDQMFEPFYTTKPQGLGMGLSISRSIVEAHGGHLWATRNDKKGMTLSFTLPCDQARSSG